MGPSHYKYAARVAATPGHALNRKVREAEEAFQAQGRAFLPLVVESFSGRGEVARHVVRCLATALARQTGKPEDETLSHVWGRLATILQRSNARILANRQPYHIWSPVREAFK